MDISHLEPKLVWKHFQNLCAIPRISGHEEAASKFVIQFAQNLGLDCQYDKMGNVLVKKSSKSQSQPQPTILLQSHLDMVPQKNRDSDHNFLTDPIIPCIDNGWVKASGTTLGADNGIGAAIMLALLEDNSFSHGPLNCLFTVDEEVGMSGASKLDESYVNGDILINLDTEDEAEICIGCAGGTDLCMEMTLDEMSPPENYVSYQLTIGGLLGGHSGLDIHLGRGNALKVINRILNSIQKEIPLFLHTLQGGSARNAIPRESEAVICILPEHQEKLHQIVENCSKIIQDELRYADPGLKVALSSYKFPPYGKVLKKESLIKLINTVFACPNGVLRMSDTAKGVVETSNNLSIILLDKGVAKIECMLRSSIGSRMVETQCMIESLFDLVSAKITIRGKYPAWQPNPESKVISIMKKEMKNLHGIDLTLKIVHAGLECGILSKKHPGMDIVSCGPTIRFPHSPDEAVMIESVERFYKFIKNTLEKIQN